MQLIIVSLFLSLVSSSCYAQDVEYNQVQQTVSRYLESIDHSSEREWRKKNINKLYHPDINGLGASMKYNSISETLPEYRGINIVTQIKVGITKKGYEYVDTNKQKNSLEDAYFIKLNYKLLAVYYEKEGKVYQKKIYEKPIDASMYLVLAIDPNDKMYKVIDQYPTFLTELMSDKQFMKNTDEFSDDKEFLDKVSEEIKNRKY